jgi:hypothetical protein
LLPADGGWRPRNVAGRPPARRCPCRRRSRHAAIPRSRPTDAPSSYPRRTALGPTPLVSQGISAAMGLAVAAEVPAREASGSSRRGRTRRRDDPTDATWHHARAATGIRVNVRRTNDRDPRKRDGRRERRVQRKKRGVDRPARSRRRPRRRFRHAASHGPPDHHAAPLSLGGRCDSGDRPDFAVPMDKKRLWPLASDLDRW